MFEIEESDDLLDRISVDGHETDGRERHSDDARRDVRQIQVEPVLLIHVTHFILRDFLRRKEKEAGREGEGDIN